ncbi:alpha/beta hydrolase family protein [Foetidibacter luteolus]|uniref:alpha/beta hydrolase family protein n=1 Tax=Foetidibacter luteolus TaxID=2608880 RepID=UPI00129AAA71|nr:alpha/beta family hydrolase [Foetidibacter luteolus]
MKKKTASVKVATTIGSVTAEYILPEKAKCLLTLAHGAGAGMNHAFLVTLAGALANAGIATVRFNFPFMENKKGRPDTPAVAHQTIQAVTAHAKKTSPALPLFVSGKSFGGRMSSQLLAAHPPAAVKGIIFYGFPLHPAGKPSVERAEHLKEILVPMLFLQGTKDTLATWELIEEVCAALPAAQLEKIDGADHSFKAGKRDVISELASITNDWIDKILQH